MTPQEQRFLRVLEEVRDEKVKNRRIPTFTLETELSRRLEGSDATTARETAEKLQSRGVIRIGRTINLAYYEIVGSEQDPDAEIEQSLFNN